jgi:peptidylprolyl isomerase
VTASVSGSSSLSLISPSCADAGTARFLGVPVWPVDIGWRRGATPLTGVAEPFQGDQAVAQNLVLTLDSGGDVVIRLRPDLAPQHVARISELASEGFYDGVVFHRVIAGFMAQGGDPTGTGGGGSNKPNVGAEFSREPHKRGTASMARTSDPDSANSQFFLCLDDCGFLDGQYTVWGEVIEGMDYVDALPKGEPPRNPGKILKASLRD